VEKDSFSVVLVFVGGVWWREESKQQHVKENGANRQLQIVN
jgi:hypothetical protein